MRLAVVCRAVVCNGEQADSVIMKSHYMTQLGHLVVASEAYASQSNLAANGLRLTLNPGLLRLIPSPINCLKIQKTLPRFLTLCSG